jgi:hypothetical protein
VQTGFAEPETLLPFLMDTHAFDLFVDAVGLKAAEHRNLWKALGNRQIRFRPHESSNMLLSFCYHHKGGSHKASKMLQPVIQSNPLHCYYSFRLEKATFPRGDGGFSFAASWRFSVRNVFL